MEENKEKTYDYANYYGSLGQDMNQFEENLELLIHSLKATDEYIKYQQARKKIKEYPEKEKEVNGFRNRNFTIRETLDVDLFELMNQLDRDYMNFRKDPISSEFLIAELALCRLIQNMNWKLMKEIDFEVGFMDEE